MLIRNFTKEFKQTIVDLVIQYNNEQLHSSIAYKTPAEKELEIRLKNYIKVA